jgi:hypothetical protein
MDGRCRPLIAGRDTTDGVGSSPRGTLALAAGMYVTNTA